MPGMAIIPITLHGMKGESVRNDSRSRVVVVPHLVDVGRECEAEGVAGDRLARLEAGGSEGEVHLNLVLIFAAPIGL